MYKKILVAVDGSDHAIRAAKHAVHIASLAEGTAVEIVYVLDYAKAKSDVLHSESREQLTSERRQKLAPIEKLFEPTDLSYDITLLHGDPGPTVVTYANDNAFDLVIVGSRGLNTLQEMVLGSVSHKVAKRVNCPVLIVK